MKKIYCLTLFFVSLLIQTKALKILMLPESFPHAPRAYINNQIAGLLDAGHEVIILAKWPGESYGCPIYEKYDLKRRTFYDELPEYLRKFDVVYAQFGGEGIRAMNLIKEGYISGKLIVSFRGDDVTSKLYSDPHIYDELFNFSDVCLPVCEQFKDILISYGCKAEKIKVLYSSIDCDAFRFFDRRQVKNGVINILTVSRLNARKGVEYCIEAMKQLRKHFKNITLTIIGDGRLYRKLKNLIDSLELRDYVFLVGYKSHEEIIKYLQDTTIFIYSAVTTEKIKQDGIANVLKEAMATGLAPVTTDHGGNGEIIEDGKNGFLVPEGNMKIFVKKIAYLITHRKERMVMGHYASQSIRETFCKDKLNSELIDLLNGLVL